jgi:hypothetical protein
MKTVMDHARGECCRQFRKRFVVADIGVDAERRSPPDATLVHPFRWDRARRGGSPSPSSLEALETHFVDRDK